jgi:ATP-binding cassette, subfamily D (ALD), peroxisomal long-chain fatty acid import protein
MYAYKDLLELAGLTTRLYTVLSTLHNLSSLSCKTRYTGDAVQLKHVDVGIPPAATSQGKVEMTDEREIPPLVRDLSFTVKEGEHLMITGSNGVGKTAIARVLAGLWAPQGPLAEVSRPTPTSGPERRNVYVVPQRAYMVAGSLLDQVIYPHSYADYLESGTTEEDLAKILEMVALKYLPEREGGWFTRKEWRDVLSGGEKQRVCETFQMTLKH